MVSVVLSPSINCSDISSDYEVYGNYKLFVTHLSSIEFLSLVNVLSTGCTPKNMVINTSYSMV